jgi:uncharacterized membrane protein YdbT with pleckstrin-like domain
MSDINIEEVDVMLETLPEPPEDFTVKTPELNERVNSARQIFDSNNNNINFDRLQEKEENIEIEQADQKQVETKKKNELLLIAGTQLGIAAATGVVTVALLYIVNPPITQTRVSEENVKEGQDWKLVLLTFVIVVFIVFILSAVLKLVRFLYENRMRAKQKKL